MNIQAPHSPRRSWYGPRLARQLDRFDRMLDGLGEAIPAAVQMAVEESIEKALCIALCRMLSRVYAAIDPTPAAPPAESNSVAEQRG
ncbi:MAG: hypothetical protein ACJ8C4_15225 [Gemmataceae bacterium]